MFATVLYLTDLAWLAGLLASVGWLGLFVEIWRHRDFVTKITDIEPIAPREGWPRLALVFSARNEGETVEAALLSMLGQDYPNLQIIAVDDRSTDATGAILDRLAATDSRLKAIHVVDLPADWLGKNHALQRASESTGSDWLLFTDADIRFVPGVLQKAVSYAERERLDHLVIAPHVLTEWTTERMFLATFTLAFLIHSPPWKIRDRRSKTALGVGAFNLVRSSVLRDVGGFEHIKLSVDDDLRLGQMLKYCGYRPALVAGGDAIAVRWHVGVRGMIRGLEKNFYAALDFKPWRVVLGIAVLIAGGIMPFVAVAAGPWWVKIVCGLSMAGIGLVFAMAEKQNGLSWPLAFSLPFGTTVLIYTILRSMFLTLKRGGVRWRDHLYPLELLKAHVKERNEWFAEVWKSTH